MTGPIQPGDWFLTSDGDAFRVEYVEAPVVGLKRPGDRERVIQRRISTLLYGEAWNGPYDDPNPPTGDTT